MNIVGAVNGVPTRGITATGSDKTLDIADNGTSSTLDVSVPIDPDTSFPYDWDEAGVSSRVAIIGGTTSGRDHFPFVAESDTGGDSTIRPYSVDLATMAKFFYTVKKWRFYMEFDFDVRFTAHDYSGHGVVQFDLVPKVRTSPAEYDLTEWSQESQVVMARSGVRCVFQLRSDGTVGAGVNEGDEIPFVTSDPTGESSSNSEDFDSSGEDWLSGELYFNLFDTKFDSAFLPFIGLRYDTISGTSNFASDGTGAGTEPNGRFYLDQDGFGHYAQLYGPTFPTGPGEYVRVAGFSCNLSPLEYWPYATKPIFDDLGNLIGGNLPVYDTDTGETLNDPLS
jgi:hypothetical protein